MIVIVSAQCGRVAQICNLPYRRFVIGRASKSSSALALADVPQNTILRYSAARPSRNQSSADFQVCCVADFQIRRLSELHRAADLEVGDTAGLETCATASVDAFRSRRAPCLLLNRRGLRRFREILIDYKPALRDHAEVSPPSVYFRIILVFAKLSRTNRCMDLSPTVSTAQR